ncbi:unnamed protein product [Merluccius merluccius]
MEGHVTEARRLHNYDRPGGVFNNDNAPYGAAGFSNRAPGPQGPNRNLRSASQKHRSPLHPPPPAETPDKRCFFKPEWRTGRRSTVGFWSVLLESD